MKRSFFVSIMLDRAFIPIVFQTNTCSGGSCVLGGTTNSSSRTKPRWYLSPVGQIIDNRLVRFGYGSFSIVNFQRPDWVCSSFSTTVAFTGLVEIAIIYVGRNFFSFAPTGLEYGVGGFDETTLALIAIASFLPDR